MIKEKVKFLEDCKVEAQGKVVAVFKAGKEYLLPAASARHWIRRNAAERVQDEPKGKVVAHITAKPPKDEKPKRGKGRKMPARFPKKEEAETE